MRPILLAALLAVTAACASETPAQFEESASQAPSGSGAAEPRTAAASAPANDPSPQTTPSEETSEMTATAQGMYALQTKALDDTPVDLSEFAGQVTLVVNVASRCGYTGQYAGLQELHAEYADRGFAVLGFPCNDFGGQEPGSPEEIQEFCSSRFGVTFPMFSKVEVKPGGGQSPVYTFLEEQTNEVPSWNFCKYLVGKDGQVIDFYASSVAPDADELREAIENAIG